MSVLPHYILKYKGKYMTGRMGWSGIGQTEFRSEAMVYSYQAIQNIFEIYPNLDVEVLKIAHSEYVLLSNIRQAKRESINAKRAYDRYTLMERINGQKNR